jgi:hypothetical protein
MKVSRIRNKSKKELVWKSRSTFQIYASAAMAKAVCLLELITMPMGNRTSGTFLALCAVVAVAMADGFHLTHVFSILHAVDSKTMPDLVGALIGKSSTLTNIAQTLTKNVLTGLSSLSFMHVLGR